MSNLFFVGSTCHVPPTYQTGSVYLHPLQR